MPIRPRMETVVRKLACIMFTDIVGYSVLSHQNDVLAMELLQEHRERLRPLFARFGGHEIRTIGDAFFLEFSSAVDAVNCAVEMQQSMARWKKLQIRIGIHLGDVMVSDQDLNGDGVNIAARLQGLARPGGICFSGEVYSQVHNKVQVPINRHGRAQIKGIKKHIYICRIDFDGENPYRTKRARLAMWKSRLISRRVTVTASVVAGSMAALFATVSPPMWKASPSDPYSHALSAVASDSVGQDSRIAILPFAAIGPQGAGAGDDYILDGMTEEITSSLSRIGSLHVLARSTVLHYRDSGKDPAQIGRELKVGLVLQGSVRRLKEHLRVTVELIDTRSQENLWSQDFDGTADDLFEIQKLIALKIASRFRSQAAATYANWSGKPLLRESEGRNPASVIPPEHAEHAERADRGLAAERQALRAGAIHAPTREAYLLYLKGRFFIAKRTEEGLRKGLDYFQHSIEKDPAFADAYVGSANAYGLLGYYGYERPRDAFTESLRSAESALRLDPRSAEALVTIAAMKGNFERDWASAETFYRKALSLNPQYQPGRHWYGTFLIARGRLDESLRQLRISLDLDPLSLITNSALGLPAFYSGKWDEALATFKTVEEMDASFAPNLTWICRTYLEKHQPQKALDYCQRALKISPFHSPTLAALARALVALNRAPEARRILQQLQSRSKERFVSPYDLAVIHSALGDSESTFRELARALEERDSYAIYAKMDPALGNLKNDSRFLKILKKAGI